MILTAFIGYVLPWGSFLPYMSFTKLAFAFYTPLIPAKNRIGPHNYDVLSFLYAALLSDAHAEKHGNGTRISFHHSRKQVSFLYWMQSFLRNRGYCKNKKRKIIKQIGKKGKIYYSIKFHTFSFQSFDWIRHEFYKKFDSSSVKRVPHSLFNY